MIFEKNLINTKNLFWFSLKVLSYTKVHSPISPLHKIMQKLVIPNIKDETLRYVLYVYNKLPTNGSSTETAMDHVITHTCETEHR
jgi:hypothetical protein